MVGVVSISHAHVLDGFADRYGYKKTIAVSVFIKALGYILMATQTEFYPFLIGCCTPALGTAIFKPGVQGTMCQSLTKKNSSVGRGTFYMLVNIGGFLGPPLAHFLYDISWPAVFLRLCGHCLAEPADAVDLQRSPYRRRAEG